MYLHAALGQIFQKTPNIFMLGGQALFWFGNFGMFGDWAFFSF